MGGLFMIERYEFINYRTNILPSLYLVIRQDTASLTTEEPRRFFCHDYQTSSVSWVPASEAAGRAFRSVCMLLQVGQNKSPYHGARAVYQHP